MPVLVFLTVAASLVGTGLVAANTSASEADAAVRLPLPAWREAYSRRFPGCVATVLWPARERPVAFVVKRLSGEVARIGVAEAVHRARNATVADDVWTIGVCRATEEPTAHIPKIHGMK